MTETDPPLDDDGPVEFVDESEEDDEIDPEKFGWYPGDAEVTPPPEDTEEP